MIDDAGALADQPLTDAMQSLSVELIGGSGGHELHRGRCTASAIASARLELATEMVSMPIRHGGHIGKACFDLTTLPFCRSTIAPR